MEEKEDDKWGKGLHRNEIRGRCKRHEKYRDVPWKTILYSTDLSIPDCGHEVSAPTSTLLLFTLPSTAGLSDTSFLLLTFKNIANLVLIKFDFDFSSLEQQSELIYIRISQNCSCLYNKTPKMIQE